jgi:hypothetical protein
MENFDWINFLQTAAAGTPFFSIFIIAAVQWIKDLRHSDGAQVVSGAGLQVVALVIGLFFGSLYMIVTNRPPAGGDWWDGLGYAFMVVLFGLIQGILASKVYQAGKDETEKLIARYNGLVK